MNLARHYHTASVLSTGKVLVAGGWKSGQLSGKLNNAELYDPSTRVWTQTGNMKYARIGHTTSILSNGNALVVGGCCQESFGGYSSSAELYDPSTEVWTEIADKHFALSSHTASVLRNGNVLIVGGYSFMNSGTYLNGATLYDPSTGNWTQTGNMNFARLDHTASLLSNGKVLVTGGKCSTGYYCYLNSAELYNPSTGVWTRTGTMNFARSQHTASVLSNGNVLVTGGQSYNSFGGCLNSAELYDPSTGVWTQTGRMSFTRYAHTASILSTGKVLVTGGYSYSVPSGYSNATELYDPTTGVWIQIGSMSFTRYTHTASTLSTGNVLVAGGYGDNGNLNSAELYS